jgi:ABC-type uncharacterized transport system substrate-binding protein
MRRREFITLLGGAAAWPVPAWAQIRRIAALIGFAETDSYGQASANAFRQGLEQLGWVEGRNIRVDYRFAAGDPALFRTYAAELIGLRPDVILAGTTPAVSVLQPLTRTIPIVFVLAADPVGQGFVQSLARPGGNITGFGVYVAPMMGKWLGLFKEVAPGVRHVAVIFNPDNAPFANSFNQAIEAAARSLGVNVTLAPVHNDATIEAAVSTEAQQPGGGVIVLPDSFVITHRKAIIASAARYRLPTFGMNDLFPRDGGLMSYSIDSVETYRQGASYIDRILKGANPADLPIQEPTKFLLILNLKTAKELGLDAPMHLQQLADEVIE